MNRYVVGLDIGTTKVCAIVARASREGAEIVAVGMSPSNGLRKGVVVDMDLTSASIESAVREAETNSGVSIKAVYVGIAGGHIECVESYGATGIRGKEVKDADIERVMESASVMYVPLDREILHVVPSEFVIDGQDGIMRPLGMSGVRLEVKVNIITASQATMENLVKCCSKAGLKVADVVLEPLASARAVLTYEEMEQGVVLVDIGGGTTDIALYKNGTLRHASVIPVGGNHFTNDISIGMRLPQREAERLKKMYASSNGKDTTEAVSLNGETRKVSWSHISEILRPRAEELFAMVKEEISEQMLEFMPTCIVLTGGMSLLKGLDKVAEARLGLPVRIGLPEKGRSALLKEISRSPIYSTGVGLLLHGYDREFSRRKDDVLGMLLEGMGSWTRNALSLHGMAGGLRRFISKVNILNVK